ncbi:MAG TPA: hypothetical protein VND21_08155 [Planctomycetota bacterium]|nr:hypothetical protein [Planctomycetota bacterium]
MAAPRRALAALAFLLAAGPALAEDAAPAAPTPYTNPEVGFSMEGPAGWRLESGAVAPPQWQSMAVFTEPGPGGAQIVVSVRKATATQLGRLRKEVSDFYAKDPSYRVNAITDLPVGGRRPLAGVLVDAVQTRPAEGTPGAGAAATANWRVQSAYFLGGEFEYRVEATVRATLAAKCQAAFDRAIESVTYKVRGGAMTPRGETSFRDDTAGFACVYPVGYGVRLPDREAHLVEFRPAGDGPVIDVRRADSTKDLDEEAQAVVDWWKGDEVGGEATLGRLEIAGRAAASVTAKGRVEGKDRVVLIGLVKRGGDLFRLEVTADEGQDAGAKAAFDAFAKKFVLLNP